MNKKGFTLIELLAVFVLIAILSGLAIPNVISSINNSRKNTFLLDAKRMVSKSEYLLSENREYRTTAKTTGITFTFNQLNENGEFATDADGGVFDSSSFVRVTYSGNKYNYCICVIGASKIISSSTICNPSTTFGCVSSDNLTGIGVVKNKN